MIDYENLELSNRSFIAEWKDAFAEFLDKGWYVLGVEVSSFENEFSSYIGSRHCIGVANGLDALTLSICALNLPAQSEILVASNTYIATILAIIHAGHRPVLVEPDIRTYNIDPNLLQQSLTSKTRAICVTHLYGKSCEMDPIMNFAKVHNLSVIEDCAQSHGAKYNGMTTGTFGSAGCFSFYPTKNLGALGDAGAILTSDVGLSKRLMHLRNYGSTQKYINEYIGYNSRLDELQAAFLRIKLRSLNKITDHKRKLAELYFNNLSGDLILPDRSPKYYDVFHIFAIRTVERDRLKTYLLERGVKTEIHYPVPPSRQIAMSGIIDGDYPIADQIHQTQLSLPISIGTSAEDVHKVCEVINYFFRHK